MADVPDYVEGQPKPVPNGGPSIHDLVLEDIEQNYHFKMYGDEPKEIAKGLVKARKDYGLSKYGTVLQAHNGRDPSRDKLEEMLDLLAYARQEVEEVPDDREHFQRKMLLMYEYKVLLKSFLAMVMIMREIRGEASS